MKLALTIPGKPFIVGEPFDYPAFQADIAAIQAAVNQVAAGPQPINPSDAPYNASGAGVLNDAPALNAAWADAVAAGGPGRVEIQAGVTHRLSAALVAQSNSVISGKGQTSVLRAANTQNDVLIRFPDGTHDVVVEDLACDGNGANQTVNGYIFELGKGCYNIWIKPSVKVSSPRAAVVHALDNRYSNVRIGSHSSYELHMQWFGADADALLFDPGRHIGGISAVAGSNVFSGFGGRARPDYLGQLATIEGAGAAGADVTGVINWVSDDATQLAIVNPAGHAAVNAATTISPTTAHLGGDGAALDAGSWTLYGLVDAAGVGLARPEMVGRRAVVEGAGAFDAAGGFQNITTTVATVASDLKSVTLVPVSISTTYGGTGATRQVRRASAAIGIPCRTRMQEVSDLAGALRAHTVNFGSGRYLLELGLYARDGVTYRGDGPDACILRGSAGAGGFGLQVHQAADVGIYGLRLQGGGRDGGPTGLVGATAGLDILESRRVGVDDVVVEDWQNCCISVRTSTNLLTTEDANAGDRHPCEDVYFGPRVLARNAYMTNGTSNATGGILWWLFGRCFRINGTINGIGADRHGLYIDPGTSSGTQNETTHGYLEDCSFPSVSMRNVGRISPGSVGIGNRGAKRLHIGSATVVGCGSRLIDATAFDLGGDQNGEYPQSCTIGRATAKDIGGAVLTVQGENNVIGELDAENWNLVQNASYKRPVQFQGAVQYTATNLVAAADCHGNRVGQLRLRYSTDPSKYVATVNVVNATAGALPLGGVLLTDTAAKTDQNGAATTFASVLEGSIVVVAGAGNGGVDLTTRAARIIDGTHILLADPALTAVGGANVTIKAADPAMYDYSVQIIGGTMGPDGSGDALRKRFQRCYDNEVGSVASTPPSQGYLTNGSSVAMSGVVTTSGSNSVTRNTTVAYVPFVGGDIPDGTPISASGIPANTVVKVVDANTLSLWQADLVTPVNATASATVTATLTLPAARFCPLSGANANTVGGRKFTRFGGVGAPIMLVQRDGDDVSRWTLDHLGKITAGPGGAAAQDADLLRLAFGTMGTNLLLRAVMGLVTRTKAGVPADADYTALGLTPLDGLTCQDTTNGRWYVRSGGTWRYAALT